MSRINVIEKDNANPEQAELLEAIEAQLGMVPNFLKVFANSPAALRAFLGLHGIAGEGSLDAATRERIALTIAQKNECQYCVSAMVLALCRFRNQREKVMPINMMNPHLWIARLK